MLDNSRIGNNLAISIATISIGFIIYFAWKTLTTSNLFQKGIKLYQVKDYNGAEAAFRQAIAINSTNEMI